MGYGRHDDQDWQTMANQRIGTKKTASEIYNSAGFDRDLNPLNFAIRESRDSENNPSSTPIIIGIDSTGSMDPLLEAVAQVGARDVINKIYDTTPIPDPHIMIVSIGDVHTDSVPIQATQFETDCRLLDQLLKLHPEHRGGGNGSESYTAAWLLAAQKTSIDCFEKRGQKGFIFTIGDDGPAPVLEARDAKRFLGIDIPKDMTAKELRDMVEEKFHVFHFTMRQGQSYSDAIAERWNKLLGKRAIVIDDAYKMSDTIVGILHQMAGRNVSTLPMASGLSASMLNQISNLN